MISLSTADNALKNVYLDVLTDQLNNSLDPFFAKIGNTTQNISGNEVKKMIPLGINGGIGAGTEVGALPTAKENSYATITSKLKNLYGTIEISDKAIRASRDEAGAFLNLLNAEMENLIESSKFNFRRMLYGDGSALVGTIASVGSTPNECSVVSPVHMAVGMRVDIYDDLNEPIEELKDVEIVGIDYVNEIIKLSKEVPEDYQLCAQLFVYLKNSKDKEFIGLKGLCDPAITNLYGIDRTVVSYMTGGAETIQSAQLTLPKVMKYIDDVRLNYDGNIDFITCGFGFRRDLQSKLKAMTSNVDIQNLQGGFKSISFNGIPIVATRFCEDKTAYFLDSSVFHLHQLCDWTWLSNNKGEVLHQREGYATHCATLVKYCDLICDRPNRVMQVSLS